MSKTQQILEGVYARYVTIAMAHGYSREQAMEVVDATKIEVGRRKGRFYIVDILREKTKEILL